VEVKISLPYHGLETANCSAALVMYEMQLMVVDGESNTGHGRKEGRTKVSKLAAGQKMKMGY
jgi:hypothetical protein